MRGALILLDSILLLLLLTLFLIHLDLLSPECRVLTYVEHMEYNGCYRYVFQEGTLTPSCTPYTP